VHLLQYGLCSKLIETDEHVPHRLLGDLCAMAPEDTLEAIQRQVIAVLRRHDMRVDRGLVLALVDHALRHRRALHRVPTGAGILAAYVTIHDELRRDEVPALGDLIANELHRFAAVRAATLRLREIDLDLFPRQVVGEGLAAVPLLLELRGRRSKFRSLGLSLQKLERSLTRLEQQQLIGIDRLAPPPKDMPLHSCELRTQALDLCVKLEDLRVRFVDIGQWLHASFLAPCARASRREYCVHFLARLSPACTT